MVLCAARQRQRLSEKSRDSAFLVASLASAQLDVAHVTPTLAKDLIFSWLENVRPATKSVSLSEGLIHSDLPSLLQRRDAGGSLRIPIGLNHAAVTRSTQSCKYLLKTTLDIWKRSLTRSPAFNALATDSRRSQISTLVAKCTICDGSCVANKRSRQKFQKNSRDSIQRLRHVANSWNPIGCEEFRCHQERLSDRSINSCQTPRTMQHA
jgi:hypothetical protein